MADPARFTDLLGTTSSILRTAEQLDLESSNGWTLRSTRSLDAFGEHLVASLLPQLAAAESVLGPHLSDELNEALKADHREIRQLAERVALISEAMARNRSARPELRHAHEALRALNEALAKLGVDQHAAVYQLKAALPDPGLDELEDSLEAAVEESRSRILLIAQPQVPPTEAYVLRRRPDLNRAYATNLAELEGRPHRRTGPAN